jgi:hypothetical protein
MDGAVAMRLLIYGMQSSGASTLAFLLAQKPDCAAFVDIWTMYVAPALPGVGDVVAKVVVTAAFPLAHHQERFRPDCTILFLRHPESNYRSLATKSYRHHCGFMEEKFGIYDRAFAGKCGVDAILYYEDLIVDPVGTLATFNDLGWSSDPGFLRLRRKQADIRRWNELQYPGIIDRLEYGMGAHRSGQLSSEFASLQKMPAPGPEISAWCPTVTEHYRVLMQEYPRKWSAGSI